MLFQKKEKIKNESRRHSAAIAAYLRVHYRGEDSVHAAAPMPCDAAPSAAQNYAAQALDAQPYACGVPAAKPQRNAKQAHVHRESGQAVAKAVDGASQTEPFAQECTQSLDDYLHQVQDESFSEMLLRIIDEKQMKDADCYKKAHIDKRLFSKIRSNSMYKPSKQTALALAVALELPYFQACEMLRKAGYAFSPASKADLIVEYYIKHGIYNILLINTSLFEFDQPLIGSY